MLVDTVVDSMVDTMYVAIHMYFQYSLQAQEFDPLFFSLHSLRLLHANIFDSTKKKIPLQYVNIST